MRPWLVCSALLLLSCARPPLSDDIVRIRPDMVPQWRNVLEDTLYGGYFLRGTALELHIRLNSRGGYDTVLFFRPISAKAEEEPPVVPIPVSQLQNIARRFGLDTTQYGGWNIVETYAVTERIPAIRTIPVRTAACDCLPLGIDLPGIRLRCPERSSQWYFLELRGLSAAYTDAPNRSSLQGRLRYAAEVAAGLRLGAYRQWGIGIAYHSGLPVYNSFRSELLRRPAALLYVRYQFGNETVSRRRKQYVRIRIPHCPEEMTAYQEEWVDLSTGQPLLQCIRPFVYGQLGMNLDRLTLRMGRFWLSQKQECSDCVRFIRQLEASGRLPEVDFSLPLSWGIGIGAEVALTRWMDFGVDLGWRSFAVGEETALLGFQNVPSTRRLSMLVLRAGLTF